MHVLIRAWRAVLCVVHIPYRTRTGSTEGWLDMNMSTERAVHASCTPLLERCRPLRYTLEHFSVSICYDASRPASRPLPSPSLPSLPPSPPLPPSLLSPLLPSPPPLGDGVRARVVVGSHGWGSEEGGEAAVNRILPQGGGFRRLYPPGEGRALKSEK